jgi:hypothetical protein
MNGSEEPEAENKVSALLTFYTRKVFSKIKCPEKPKMKPAPYRKNKDE